MTYRIEGEGGQRALGGPVPGSMQNQNTPDDYLNDTLQSEMNAVQMKLTERWKMIQGQAKYLGPEKTSAMLQQLEMAARNKVIELKAGVQQRTDMMGRIRTLRQQGALTGAQAFNEGGSVDKMLWQIAAGPEIADQMFTQIQEPEQPDTLKEYGQLSAQEGRVEKDIEDYRIVGGERIPEFWKHKAYEKKTPKTLQVFDPLATRRVKKKGGMVTETGQWVDAPDQSREMRRLGSQRAELNLMRDAMERIREGQPSGIKGLSRLRNLSGRMITGQTKVGTLGDKINASLIQRKIGSGQVATKESARPDVRVKHRASGQPGWIPADEFNEQEYERLQ